jgi:hypothetical protein
MGQQNTKYKYGGFLGCERFNIGHLMARFRTSIDNLGWYQKKPFVL